MPQIIILLALLALACGADAQTAFTWELDLGTVFDNREGDDDHTAAETIFFTRLSPEAGIRLDDANRFAGGVVWVQPVGHEWHGAKVSPTLYYRYDGRSWSGSLGMFPRTQLIEELPSFLWGDEMRYFQRNIRGGVLQYRRPSGWAEIYLDWRQRQTDSRREAFNIVAHTSWHTSGVFSVGGTLAMDHFALTRHSAADEHIVDNFMVNPYITADFSSHSPFDSIYVKAGPLLTLERDRGADKWTTPLGVWVEAAAAWHRWSLRNTLYAGGKQMRLWDRFGQELYQGDSFYKSSFYDRLDLSYSIVGNKWVGLEASLNFNFSPGSFIFYQKITLDVNIGGAVPIKRIR